MTKKHRIACLDELRGLLLILMAIYHAQWNLQYLFGHPQQWFIEWPGFLLQTGTSTAFIVLAGVCTHFCRRPYRRAALLIGIAGGITLVTTLFSPGQGILFGIIHLMAACQLLYAVTARFLKKIPPLFGVIFFAFLFLITYHLPERILGIYSLNLYIPLPAAWYQSSVLSVFGFLSPDFFSADYFPILPYVFPFFCGHFLGYWLNRIPDALTSPHCPPLGWLGRHSLLFYLAHQPLLLGAMTVLYR